MPCSPLGECQRIQRWYRSRQFIVVQVSVKRAVRRAIANQHEDANVAQGQQRLQLPSGWWYRSGQFIAVQPSTFVPRFSRSKQARQKHIQMLQGSHLANGRRNCPAQSTFVQSSGESAISAMNPDSTQECTTHKDCRDFIWPIDEGIDPVNRVSYNCLHRM